MTEASTNTTPADSAPDMEPAAAIEALPEPRSRSGGSSSPGPMSWVTFKRRPLGADRTAPELPELAKPAPTPIFKLLMQIRDGRSRVRLVHRLRKARMLIASSLIAVVGVLTFLGALVVLMARSAPAWWVDIDTTSQATIDLADQVQNGALSHLFEDRHSEMLGAVRWPVKMTDEAANAWLNVKLPDWFAKITDGMRWPDSVEQMRMVFEDGSIRIGARVATEDGTRIYSAVLEPELRQDGSLWVRARSVSMGRLNIPAGLVLRGANADAARYIPESLRGTAEAEALFDKLAGKKPLFEDAEVHLGDGRQVKLLELRVRDGSIIALFETQ
ncbi:MAG TPA: hypothetical protein ENJ00_10055 [Phycisphaerales bacterium]|nr:hypothetical protein [Phycisphaerales bacterium]